MIEENNPNKLIEGEDFIIRLKVINALPKTPPEKRVLCRSGCRHSLWSSLTPMEKKENYE
jgi:hypothetical protein